MSRWTKVGAVRRMQGNRRLQELLQVEPELGAVLQAAVTQRRGPGYSRVQRYVALRNAAIPLVGWHARVASLRTSADYLLVVHTLMDLLPPDAGDRRDGDV